MKVVSCAVIRATCCFHSWQDYTIEILRIKHGMMDLPRLFGGKPLVE